MIAPTSRSDASRKLESADRKTRQAIEMLDAPPVIAPLPAPPTPGTRPFLTKPT